MTENIASLELKSRRTEMEDRRRQRQTPSESPGEHKTLLAPAVLLEFNRRRFEASEDDGVEVFLGPAGC